MNVRRSSVDAQRRKSAAGQRGINARSTLMARPLWIDELGSNMRQLIVVAKILSFPTCKGHRSTRSQWTHHDKRLGGAVVQMGSALPKIALPCPRHTIV